MNDTSMPSMPWWGWIAAFFAGAFLVNCIPHGVMGLTGQAFPTALSGGPPNTSGAVTNVVYSAVNLVIGLLLLRAVKRWRHTLPVQAVAAIGGLAMGVLVAWSFSTMM